VESALPQMTSGNAKSGGDKFIIEINVVNLPKL
jgi:hypothetical protein